MKGFQDMHKSVGTWMFAQFLHTKILFIKYFMFQKLQANEWKREFMQQ